MITRKQYMNHEYSHHEYYSEIAAEIGLSYSPGNRLFDLSSKSADEHFNDVPLALWDCSSPVILPYYWATAMERRGDFLTRAGITCIQKAAMRNSLLAHGIHGPFEHSSNECASKKDKVESNG